MKPSARNILQPDGSMRCASCGGVNFTAKRSTARKVAFGFASLLGSTNEVRCMSCGATYSTRQVGYAGETKAPPRPDA